MASLKADTSCEREFGSSSFHAGSSPPRGRPPTCQVGSSRTSQLLHHSHGLKGPSVKCITYSEERGSIQRLDATTNSPMSALNTVGSRMYCTHGAQRRGGE